MCGRFLLYSSIETLECTFGLELGAKRPNLEPTYNIAPTTEVAVIGAKAGRRGLARMQWGLVPSWAPDRSQAAKMINARGETVTSKPAFRAAFERRRCLVPADGFYEWQPGDKSKQPWLLELAQGGPMAMAGLFERWRNAAGASTWSCTIVTTETSADLRHLHHRKPLVLAADTWETWLVGPAERASGLLRPMAEGTLRWRAADPRVNSVKINEGSLLDPPGALLC